MHRISLYYPEAPSGTAEFYLRGTDREATVYADAAGATALSSVTLSAAGRKNVYVEDWVDVRVRTQAGVVVDEFTESVSDTAVQLESASFTGTLADGSQGAFGPVDLSTALAYWKTSAGARDFKVRLRGAAADQTLVDAFAAVTTTNQPWFNVQRYGAVADNATDNYSAFVAAHTAAAAAGGGVIYVPGASSQYYLAQSFAITHPKVSLMGDGADASVLRSGATSGFAVSFSCGASSHTGQVIRDIGIATPAAPSAVGGLSLSGCPGITLDGVEVVASYGAALQTATRTVVLGGRYTAAPLTTGHVVTFASGSSGSAMFGAHVDNTEVTTASDGTIGLLVSDTNISFTGCRVTMADTNAGGNSTRNFGAFRVTAAGCRIQGCTITTVATPAITLPSDVAFRETNNTFTTTSGADLLGQVSYIADIHRGSRVGRSVTATNPATYSASQKAEVHFINTNVAVTLSAPDQATEFPGHGSRLLFVFRNNAAGVLVMTFSNAVGGFRSSGTLSLDPAKHGCVEFVYDAAQSAAQPWIEAGRLWNV